jgi:retron-type reverse transcriptase
MCLAKSSSLDEWLMKQEWSAHEAVDRVARAIVQHKTRVIDIDLRSYFDNIRHDRLLAKVARRLESKATANSQ